MAEQQMPPNDHFVTSFQFTKTLHRDDYPAIDPTLPQHSQAGKVAMITGATRGIGRVRHPPAQRFQAAVF
jgi:hypothetical protein